MCSGLIFRVSKDTSAKTGRPPVPLPDKLVFVGHSAGVEAVLYVAQRLNSTYPAKFAQMRGIVSEDGVKSFIGSNTDDALAGLPGTALLIYATASQSYLCNDFQSGTKGDRKVSGHPAVSRGQRHHRRPR